MVRFLTPAKIGLLVLIQLYAEEAVPSEAILPVLSFIASHLLDRDRKNTSERSLRWGKAKRTADLVASIKEFEKLLGSYPFVMGMPGRRLWDQFVDKLWAINSLDAMHQFLLDLQLLLPKTKAQLRREGQTGSPEPEPGVKLSKHSFLGGFVREVLYEVGELPFFDISVLWKDFVKYRLPTAAYMKRKNPDHGQLDFDHVLSLHADNGWDAEEARTLACAVYGDMVGDRTKPVSTDDITMLLEFQIEQMQKYGSRVPSNVRDQFRSLLDDNTLRPSLNHYLNFLDSWRAGDFPTAFDLLHRYFDYTMSNRDRYFYQYALMNLAVLQADFGCHKEAVAAMLETVSTARENRDITCLNFALNWLYHFGRAHPELVRDLEDYSMLGSGKESLAFLRVKAKEMGMWTLWSSVLLSEAKLTLINGDSIATSFEFLVRSSQVILERNMKNMFASHMSVSTSVWDRFGVAHMSTMACQVFLRCHAQNSMFDEEVKMTCRLAGTLVGRGKYDEALQLLESMDEDSLRSWKPKQYWHKYRGIIKLKRDLHRGNLDGAEELLAQLLQSKHEDMEPDLSFVIDLMDIDYLTRRGDLQGAYAKADVLLLKLRDEQKDIAIRVRLLLVKVDLLDKCGRPQRAFTTAMRAASLAWRARLMTSLWHAIGAVSNLLISMGDFDSASELLHSVIPRALECELDDLAGQLYSYLADAHMGKAGEADGVRRTERLAAARRAVQKAFDHYSALEDIGKQCEMMAKKATIMKLSGDMELAASYAAAYCSLKETEELYREGLA